MTTWKQHREQLLANPEIAKEYDAIQPRMDAIRGLIKARAECGLTQLQLASLLGTTQNSISRLESGAHEPHLSTLAKTAHAMGYSVHVEYRKTLAGP